MTTEAPPPVRDLPLGLRQFHSRMLERALKAKTSVVEVCEDKTVQDTPWSHALWKCDEASMGITYDTRSRTLLVTVRGRNRTDTHDEPGLGGKMFPVADWPLEETLKVPLHEAPAGTKKFLRSLV